MTEYRGCWIKDQEVWGSILPSGDMRKCLVNFAFHSAYSYLVALVTYGREIVSEWIKLSVYLYDVRCILPFKEMRLLKSVSYTREGNGRLNI